MPFAQANYRERGKSTRIRLLETTPQMLVGRLCIYAGGLPESECPFMLA